MRKFLMIFSVFALVVSITADLAHAHTTSLDTQTQISADMDSGPDNSAYPGCCDMACGGCGMHHHHHAANGLSDGFSLQAATKDRQGFGAESIYLSDFVYGLKRPPRI
ncbi:MAG: hypothetical protein H6859_00320 [Rhodospirillales bacterium]|nr:hypothetical protein [Alphaproteobacteria bacterium]USO05687.1 MAG: hypothetical protein H6859_00320 [Rhodospirillales bacterium]